MSVGAMPNSARAWSQTPTLRAAPVSTTAGRGAAMKYPEVWRGRPRSHRSTARTVATTSTLVMLPKRPSRLAGRVSDEEVKDRAGGRMGINRVALGPVQDLTEPGVSTQRGPQVNGQRLLDQRQHLAFGPPAATCLKRTGRP